MNALFELVGINKLSNNNNMDEGPCVSRENDTIIVEGLTVVLYLHSENEQI